MVLAAMLLSVIQVCGQVPADDVSSGLYVVTKHGRYGYIDRTGQMKIDFRFTDAGPFHDGRAVASIDIRRELYGYIDTSGEFVVQPAWEHARPFSEGLAAVRADDAWGYIDENGRMVITPQYYDAHPFDGGVALVATTTSLAPLETFLDTDILQNVGYINKDGKRLSVDSPGPIGVILPLNVEHRRPLSFVVQYRSGFIDRFGKWKIEQKYDWAKPFSEGLALVEVKGKYGFIDDSGRFVISPTFDSARSFQEGRAAVSVNDGWGVIDTAGRWIVEPTYYELSSFKESLAAFREKRSGPEGYIDRTGSVVIQPSFDHAYGFDGGVAEVVVDRKTGYIDTSGKFIWDPRSN